MRDGWGVDGGARALMISSQRELYILDCGWLVHSELGYVLVGAVLIWTGMLVMSSQMVARSWETDLCWC